MLSCLVIALLCSQVFALELIDGPSFAAYEGNGAAAGGAAGALDTNVWRLQLFSSANVPYEGMSTDQSEYSRGLVSLADSTNDAKIASGYVLPSCCVRQCVYLSVTITNYRTCRIGAIEVASGVRAMFLQPACEFFGFRF